MCGLQLAIGQLVANRGPSKLSTEPHLKTVFGKETQLLRHDERGTVVQRNETHANLR